MAERNNDPGRRSYGRYETNVTAFVRRGADGPETVLMENISARGAAVLGYKPLSINEKLTIHFHLPFFSTRLIQKQAHVTWCTQIKEGVWEAGIDFGLDNMLLLH